MRFLHSWMLRILMVSLIALIIPAAPTHAAEPTWQDLPDNLFDRMVCFDGSNADVLWAYDGNAYAWKTSTQLTHYDAGNNRSMGTRWCSDDGYFYSTEMTTTYNSSGSYSYSDIRLTRRSLAQAPVDVTTLTSDVVAHHMDANGRMSIITFNNRQMVVSQSSTGVTWSNHAYTFAEAVVAQHIAPHDTATIYAITTPQTAYAATEQLPRNRTISQFSLWQSTDAGQHWRKQATLSLPQACTIYVYAPSGNVGNYPDYLTSATDTTTCYAIQLQVQFVQTPTRYTSPTALAIQITYLHNNLRTGKNMFSRDSGRTWQDVQHIQGVSSTSYRSFFNDTVYPASMNRTMPELIYTPSRIFFSAYVTQHLNSSHGGVDDPLQTSVTRAAAMSTVDQRTWSPVSQGLESMCEDTNASDGNQLLTVATLPLIRICKNKDGIAYLDVGAWQWRQISTDYPYARIVAVSDTLPVTIVRQVCQPSPRYGQYPTLDCTTMQYLQVMPSKAVTTPVTLSTPLAVPFERVTQHTIEPRFQRYWQQHGGLAQFGYPISEPFFTITPEGKRMLVQYFERNRFEWHPENAGTPYEVQLGLIGNYYGAKAQLAQPGPFAHQSGNTEPGQMYFAETGHTLRNAFKRHWLGTGGLAQYGYPISEEFYEVNPADGQTYVVQYFERARFEWHPEHMGTPYEVLLGLLGQQLLAESGY